MEALPFIQSGKMGRTMVAMRPWLRVANQVFGNPLMRCGPPPKNEAGEMAHLIIPSICGGLGQPRPTFPRRVGRGCPSPPVWRVGAARCAASETGVQRNVAGEGEKGLS